MVIKLNESENKTGVKGVKPLIKEGRVIDFTKFSSYNINVSIALAVKKAFRSTRKPGGGVRRKEWVRS